jgi:hypothetical protein
MQATTMSSTAGYHYFGSNNNNAVPTLPTLKTNISKFTFSSQTYSTASGSTPGIDFTSPGGAQSSTKGYVGGTMTQGGDLYTPTFNYSNALRILTFSSETLATSGTSLTGAFAGLTQGGNSTTTGYFLGRRGNPVSAYYDTTGYNYISSVNFSNDTTANPGTTISDIGVPTGITNSKSKLYYAMSAAATSAYNHTNNTNATVAVGTVGSPSSYGLQSYGIMP